jgi:nucleoside 2-deoxyribosyltransferase
LKIYLAGKWEENKIISEYAAELRSLAHEITIPWFEWHVGPEISQKQGAMEDTQGVRMADCCIFIFEKDLNYRGAYTELGMAIALGKRIIVVGHAGDRNIFLHYPLVEQVETWEEAKIVLKGSRR